MLKLGYKASNEQFAPTELLRYGVLAEECGFDSVFVSDHLQPWRHDGGHAPFAMSWLGALGARTERILMGTVGADADVPLPPGRSSPRPSRPLAACSRTGSSSGWAPASR